jgi:hypothetical protein
MDAEQVAEEAQHAEAPRPGGRPHAEANIRRTAAQRFGRHAVLAIPLVLVNGAAVYGQVQWATANLTSGSVGLAVLFALTVESIAVYLAYEAHAALLAGDASFRLRVASYVAAGLVGALNYSHFADPGFQPTATALAFGGLSSISPWLWSIRSRSLRRDQLRVAGLIDPRSAHFATAKWVNFPIRTLRAYRWSVDHGVQEERAAWEAYRATQQKHQSDGRLRQLAQGRPNPRSRNALDEHAIEEHGHSALRPDRRTAIKASAAPSEDHVPASHGPELALDRADWNAHPEQPSGVVANGSSEASNGLPSTPHSQLGELRDRVHEALATGERVTGETIAQWLGVSPRTGRRRLALLIEEDPVLSDVLARE